MLPLFDTLVAELLAIAPEFFLLPGVPTLPRLRAPRFLVVRHGSRAVLVES
ncbi:MAG: hypothetical protein ACOYLS_04345 [Polymorphobacter sp.]